MSKAEAYFWWAQAFYEWDTAMEYANRRARALEIRQKVYYRQETGRQKPNWIVRSG